MKRMPFHTTALLRRFAAGFFLVAGMLSCSAPQATFTNPLRDGADPWITKYDGRYYTCFKSGRGIAVTESDDMTRFERERVVWQPADSGAWNSFNIWAPELHRLRGKWYIYYAAAPVPGSPFTCSLRRLTGRFPCMSAMSIFLRFSMCCLRGRLFFSGKRTAFIFSGAA